MDGLSIHEIIESLKKEDRKILTSVYNNFFPGIKQFVISNSGTFHDAEDIFQDALLIIYIKISNKSLSINCSFGSFLFSVSRNLWLRELKKRKTHGIHTTDFTDISDKNCNLHADFIMLEKRSLFYEILEDLSDECRKLLTLSLNNTPDEKITELMGYSSVQYTRNRRTLCKERLIKKLWNSRKFKELTDADESEQMKIPRW